MSSQVIPLANEHAFVGNNPITRQDYLGLKDVLMRIYHNLDLDNATQDQVIRVFQNCFKKHDKRPVQCVKIVFSPTKKDNASLPEAMLGFNDAKTYLALAAFVHNKILSYGAQAGPWSAHINEVRIGDWASDMGVKLSVAKGVVIAHELGFHCIAGKFDGNVPNGFVDSSPPLAKSTAVFSDDTCTAIVKKMAIDVE